MSGAWQVEPDADDAAAYAALAGDRLWNGYSIADLEPPFRAHSRFALARRGAAPPSAACLLLRHPAFNSLIPHGDPDGLAAILERAAASGDLPDSSYVLAREPHLPALARWYAFPSDPQAMLRMAVDAASFRPLAARVAGVERLGSADLPALLDLYAGYTLSAFNADQFASGVFYGVRAGDVGGEIVAAGGTHVLAARYGIAAIGSVYTRPEARGRGYASAITAAVTAELLAGPYRDVILNVAVANEPAARIYRRLGYREHCRYRESKVEGLKV